MLYIKDSIEDSWEIQRSKFITLITPLNDVGEAKVILDEAKKKYPKANHYCYAYIFDGYMKLSDDGEPSSTAGRPMLNVLLSKELNRLFVVTIRYFGGIKLGAGGLLRAYVHSVSQALQKLDLYEEKKQNIYQIKISYNQFELLQRVLKEANYQILEKKFEEEIELMVSSSSEDTNYLIDKLNGQIKIEKIKEEKVLVALSSGLTENQK